MLRLSTQAGVLSKSKGLSYILEAMRIVQRKGYDISLTIAGKYTPAQKYQFSIEYSDLSLNMMGRVSFEELKNHYQESDIGVIASLQEQASYVALEMAMFGLPIITTAVDGLDETFTEGLNALKVDTHFSKVLGLGVDVEMMAACLIELIDNMQLRKSLGKNARQLYEEKLKLDHMMEKTIEMYKRVGGFA